jgi:Zn-dependent protease with chaperone function
MGAAQVDSAPGPVDVRLLGAGTVLRFTLLVSLILASCLSMLSRIAPQDAVDGVTWDWLCLLASGVDPAQPATGAGDVVADLQRTCIAEHEAVRVRWILAGTGAVLLLALAIYLWLPSWKRRGGRLVPVDALGDEDLIARLHELVAVAGLARPPAFVVDPSSASTGAVVFGRLRRYTVCLDGGLIASRSANPDGFRGVVLHELAHIRNGDIDLTYATVALWRAFVICVLVPFLALAAYSVTGMEVRFSYVPGLWWASWSLKLQYLFQAAVLVTMSYLVRAEILRTREIYADLDAMRWGASRTAWQRPGGGNETRVPLLRPVLGLLRTHPSWADRNRFLRDPAELFGASALLMFLTGVSAILTATDIEPVLDSLGLPPGTGIETLTTWITAALVTGIAGVALWRAVAHAVLTSRPVPSGLRVGCWLGAGFAVGELVAARWVGAGWLPPHPEVLLVLVPGAAVLTWWVVQCAELWVRTHRGRSIWPVHLLGLAATALVFGAWFTIWTTELYLFSQGLPWSPNQLAALTPNEPDWVVLAVFFTVRPAVFVGAAVLWLFPLASWLRRPVTGTNTPSLRGIGVAVVLGGALCWVGAVVVMAVLHPRQPEFGAPAGDLPIDYLSGLMLALCAGAVLTAGVVSALVRRHRLVLALTAAGGAALIGLVGEFFIAGTDGCVPPLRVMGYTCGLNTEGAWFTITFVAPIVLGAAIHLGVVAAVVGAAVAALARRFTATMKGFPTARRDSTRSVLTHRIAVLAAWAMLVVLAVGSAPTWQRQLSGPTSDSGEFLPDREPPSSATAKEQGQAWLTVGGEALLSDLGTDLERAVDALLEAEMAARRAGLRTIPLEPSVFDPVCADMARHARNAVAFIPIPDVPAQRAWSTVLANAERFASDCREAVRDPDTGLPRPQLEAILRSTDSYLELTRQLSSLGLSLHQ